MVLCAFCHRHQLVEGVKLVKLFCFEKGRLSMLLRTPSCPLHLGGVIVLLFCIDAQKFDEMGIVRQIPRV